MVKICGNSIYKLLHLIFRASLDQEIFPRCWKIANVAPIYKKITNNQSRTTDQFLFFQYAGKCSKDCFVTKYFLFH